jgi:hypothetical protein
MYRTHVLHADTHVASYTQDVYVCRMCVFRYSVCVTLVHFQPTNTAICSEMYVKLPSFRLHRNQFSTDMEMIGIPATFCHEHPKKKPMRFIWCIHNCTPVHWKAYNSPASEMIASQKYWTFIIHSLVFSLRGWVGKNRSPVMWPVWLWDTASCASSWG